MGGSASSLSLFCRLGQLQIDDRILSLGNVHTDGVTLQQAHKLVQESGATLDMEVEFDVQGEPLG